MYPLEQCIRFHIESKVDASWLELLTCDDAYMHAAIFASQAYKLSTSNGLYSMPAAMRNIIVHQSTAMRLLHERLSVVEGSSITDSTVLVVLYLTLHAHLTAAYATTKHHMDGLYRIVGLRGGVAAFRDNTKPVIELLKCDLGIALTNNTRPLFADDPALEALTSPPPQSTAMPLPPEDHDMVIPENPFSWRPAALGIDTELLQIWTVIDRFCARVNNAAKTKRLLPKEALLEAMAFPMYRLMRMAGRYQSTFLDETVRLGLLAFASHIFLT